MSEQTNTATIPMAWRPLPEVGSVWHERSRPYQRRTVRVVEADEAFIHVDTLTVSSGEPPKRPVRSRIRRTQWHYRYALDQNGSREDS